MLYIEYNLSEFYSRGDFLGGATGIVRNDKRTDSTYKLSDYFGVPWFSHIFRYDADSILVTNGLCFVL